MSLRNIEPGLPDVPPHGIQRTRPIATKAADIDIAAELLAERRANAQVARWVQALLAPVGVLAERLGIEIHLSVRARGKKIAVQMLPPPVTE